MPDRDKTETDQGDCARSVQGDVGSFWGETGAKASGSSRDHEPSITAVTSGQSHTPGQHLHAMFVAHFSGGGWADAPLWDDFDEAGHARWEVNAEAIARNIRVALAAPDMLEALKGLVRVYDDEFGIVAPEMDAALAAIIKAEGRPLAVVDQVASERSRAP